MIKRELGRDQDVEAAPTVNFSRLDSVLILVTPPTDEGPEPGAPPTRTARKP